MGKVAVAIPWRERLWANIRPVESGCWEWMGHVCPTTGYGQLWADGSAKRVHRLSYRSVFPHHDIDKLVLLHLCDNRRCCRPSHLLPGTQLENVRDMIGKGRAGLPHLRAKQREFLDAVRHNPKYTTFQSRG